MLEEGKNPKIYQDVGLDLIHFLPLILAFSFSLTTSNNCQLTKSSTFLWPKNSSMLLCRQPLVYHFICNEETIKDLSINDSITDQLRDTDMGESFLSFYTKTFATNFLCSTQGEGSIVVFHMNQANVKFLQAFVTIVKIKP